jgi:hypothetical protein
MDLHGLAIVYCWRDYPVNECCQWTLLSHLFHVFVGNYLHAFFGHINVLTRRFVYLSRSLAALCLDIAKLFIKLMKIGACQGSHRIIGILRICYPVCCFTLKMIMIPTTTETESLPSYSREPSSSVVPAVLPPCYSLQPHADEETVAHTPRVANTTPHGLFIRQWPQATLILKGQDEGSRQPTYGRAGRIVGELGIANPEKVARVTVKVCRMLSYLRVHLPSRDEFEAVVKHVCLVLFSLLSCLRFLKCLRSAYFYI